MKRIGIIGGMSPESTIHYYEGINRLVNERCGGHASADLVLRSVNFEEYCKLMEAGNWEEIFEKLDAEAWTLVKACECDYVAIATNTMHKVAEKICSDERIRDGFRWQSSVHAPEQKFVHIGDCVAAECIKRNFKRVALIGTRITMTDSFMRKRLRKNGLTVVNPFGKKEIGEIDRIIFEELCHGKVDWRSAEKIVNILVESERRDKKKGGSGFDAVGLGCTELGMLCTDFKEIDGHFALIDSTEAHINRLVELCLS